MGITYGDYLIDSGHNDITPEQERERDEMRDDFAWLIEKGSGSDLAYYAPTEPGEWTKDHLKACRFARKQDAGAIQFRHVKTGHLPVYGSRVCKHGWS